MSCEERRGTEIDVLSYSLIGQFPYRMLFKLYNLSSNTCSLQFVKQGEKREIYIYRERETETARQDTQTEKEKETDRER